MAYSDYVLAYICFVSTGQGQRCYTLSASNLQKCQVKPIIFGNQTRDAAVHDLRVNLTDRIGGGKKTSSWS